VVLDGKLLGKPKDDANAVNMLRQLSGRVHQVVTGITVIDAETGRLCSSAVSSEVRFRSLSAETIAEYVATGEPGDKAGAYAIQGLGAGLVSELAGCFTNVVGLPLCETAAVLSQSGVVISENWPGCHLPDGQRCPRQV
jgi:septum formation protein